MVTPVSRHSLGELGVCARLGLTVPAPLVFRDEFRGAAGVFTLADARRLFTDDAHRVGELYPGHGMVGMVIDQRLADAGEYSSLPDAIALQGAGATIMFRALHVFAPRVRVVCQGIANLVALPVHAVGYWTPPASQGFPLHADPDSVLALHTLGRKTWAFVNPRVASVTDPNLGWVASPDEAMKPPFEEAERVLSVEAGRALFIPRGWGHCAVTDGVEAIHVSFGILHPEIGEDTIDRQFPVYPVA